MQITILLYKGFTALDVVGAYEILCRLPQAEVTFAAKEKGIIESEYASLKMIATASLAEVERTDILLVPGSTVAFNKVAKDGEVLHHLRRISETTRWTTGVCTGAVILGAAGLLNGKQATTHWAVLDSLSQFGALPKAERYVRDGKLLTAAGVSAGIDMALYLAGIIVNDNYAKMLQLVTEYYPEPPVNIAEMSAVPKQVEMEAREFLKQEIQKMSPYTAALN